MAGKGGVAFSTQFSICDCFSEWREGQEYRSCLVLDKRKYERSDNKMCSCGNTAFQPVSGFLVFYSAALVFDQGLWNTFEKGHQIPYLTHAAYIIAGRGR